MRDILAPRKDSWKCVLRPVDVITILRLHRNGEPVSRIAFQFQQVSQRQIYRIINGEKWRWTFESYTKLFRRK